MAFAYKYLGWFGPIIFSLPVFVIHSAQKSYIGRTEQNVAELKRMNAELASANEQIKSAGAAIQQLNDELFFTLGKIIDARDPFVLNHASQVAVYALAVGKEFGLAPSRLEALRQAAFLHDIGKIGISEAILQKNGQLTAEEYEIVKQHSALGASFLESSVALRHPAPFVRHHHERWDGTGYPDRLKGEGIPLEARILAVCDAVEAMASDRPYHKGRSVHLIIDKIKRCAATQFDPVVATTFIRILESEANLVENTASEESHKNEHTPHLLRESSELIPLRNLYHIARVMRERTVAQLP